MRPTRLRQDCGEASQREAQGELRAREGNSSGPAICDRARSGWNGEESAVGSGSAGGGCTARVTGWGSVQFDHVDAFAEKFEALEKALALRTWLLGPERLEISMQVLVLEE
jgi:hypothetical protein